MCYNLDSCLALLHFAAAGFALKQQVSLGLKFMGKSGASLGFGMRLMIYWMMINPFNKEICPSFSHADIYDYPQFHKQKLSLQTLTFHEFSGAIIDSWNAWFFWIFISSWISTKDVLNISVFCDNLDTYQIKCKTVSGKIDQ